MMKFGSRLEFTGVGLLGSKARPIRRLAACFAGLAGGCLLVLPAVGAAQGVSFGGSAEAEIDPEKGITSDASGSVGANGEASAAAPAPEQAPTDVEPVTREENLPAPAPVPSPVDSGQTHMVQEGDTLWSVSDGYFSDPYQWPRLWSYNPDITNPHWIYPGHALRLSPADGGGPAITGLGTGPGGVPIVAARKAVSRRGPRSVVLREQAYLDKDALVNSGKIVGSSETHMMLTRTDEVYVKFEEAPRAPMGREMTIFRRLTPEENRPQAAKPHEYDEEDEGGAIVRVLGTIKVIGYDPEKKMATGEIVEALDPIERGFKIADVPRAFLEVEAVTNQKSLESTVVAAMRPVELMGQQQMIFVGVGKKAGVKPGNRFFVLRQGDGWRDTLLTSEEEQGAARPVRNADGSEFPYEIIGELQVIHVRPESATALVSHAVVEIVPGDVVQMRDGY